VATFVPASKTALVEIIGSLLNNEAINTLFVQFAVTITEALLEELCDAVKDWWVNNNMSYISSAYTFNAVRSTDQTTQVGPSFLKVYTPTAGGTSDTGPLPGNVSLAQKFATAKRGRSYRGRNFLAGLPVSALASGDHNQVSLTEIGNLLTAWTQLPISLAGMSSPGVWVVCSRFSLGAPRSSAILTPITAVEISTATDSQRRRLNGRGA
jgi:hypothetical protein